MIEGFADEFGIILRRDVIAAGADDKCLLRARKANHVVRIRQGAYCVSTVWAAATPAERHRLLARAVRKLYEDDVALSHVSALLAQGGPDWRLPLSHVHLTSLDGVGERTQAKVKHHRGGLWVGDLRRDELGWITTAPRTALDVASIVERDPGICVLDWVQQRGLAARSELTDGVACKKEWPDTLALKLRVDLSCGRCESVGETRTHLLCHDQHLPEPVPQFEIFHPSGRLAGRVDFAWPELKVMAEFDGLKKYLALRRDGETIEQCVIREKAREDLLRRLTGWRMIRLVWADLEHPRATAEMIREFLLPIAA